MVASCRAAALAACWVALAGCTSSAAKPNTIPSTLLGIVGIVGITELSAG
jgi:hypothetical protein